jgi:heme-degrading monooxygenase HmoA
MYATVRTYSGSSDLADALVEKESDVKRLISAIDGFRAYYLVRTGDGAVSVSVYDDQAGAEESTRQAAEWIRDNLSDLSVGQPQVSAGEVEIAF